MNIPTEQPDIFNSKDLNSIVIQKLIHCKPKKYHFLNKNNWHNLHLDYHYIIVGEINNNTALILCIEDKELLFIEKDRLELI